MQVLTACSHTEAHMPILCASQDITYTINSTIQIQKETMSSKLEKEEKAVMWKS
jgi:hypothetical protein